MTPYYESWQKDVHAERRYYLCGLPLRTGREIYFQSQAPRPDAIDTVCRLALSVKLRPRGHISNQSCMTADCHPAGSFESESLIFPKPEPGQLPQAFTQALLARESIWEYFPLIRNFNVPHAMNIVPEKHIWRCSARPVTSATLIRKEFNTERARCLLCHELPEEAHST